MNQPRERGGNPGSAQQSWLTEQDLSEIFEKGNPERLVSKAAKLGEKLVEGKLTTSQIRNVFGQVRQIEMRWRQEPKEAYRQAVLLKPKLAYYSKRHEPLEPLAKILSQALDLMIRGKDEEERHRRFLHFVEFFEAVLAYQNMAAERADRLTAQRDE
ncbi:MAG: type III-A CRISPR-associated protein Csm2 [Anaerolineae bacterium]